MNITQGHRFHRLVDSSQDNIAALLHLHHLPHLEPTTVTCEVTQVDTIPAPITATNHHTYEIIIATMGPSFLNEHRFDHAMECQSPP